MKARLISYKRLFLIMCVVLSFSLSLLVNSIFSKEVGVNAQENLPLQTEKVISSSKSIASASCSLVDYRQPKTDKDINPDTQFDFEEAVFVNPPNPEGVTKVSLGFYVINISHVNEVENTYRLEGIIDLVWCDPRLKDKTQSQLTSPKTYLEEDAALKLKRIWWPDLTFVNEIGEYLRNNEELIIFADGTVEYQEKFSVELKFFFDLTKFPFDEQLLDVELESFAWNENYLKLYKEDNEIGFAPHLDLPEWEIADITSQIKQEQKLRENELFSRFLMQIKLIRKPGFYLWKVIIPVIILVIISWSVFWMVEDSLAERISFSLTGILTVVAYQFLIAENLPNISYITFMDAVLSISLAIMALTVAENIIISNLNMSDKKVLALQLDLLCRLAFPTIYLVSLLALSFFYGLMNLR